MTGRQRDAHRSSSEDEPDLRMVYDPVTDRDDEVTQELFDELLRDGKIEQAMVRSSRDGRPRRVYRYV
jgi:hypothetical protein